MIEFLLQSAAPLWVKIGGYNFYVDHSSKKLLRLKAENSFDIKYHFAELDSVVCCAKIAFKNGECHCNNKNIKVVKCQKNRFLLQILQKNGCFLQKKVKKLCKNNFVFNFFENGLIEIETEDEIKFSKIFDCQILDARVDFLAGGFVAIGVVGGQSENVVLLSSNFVEVGFFENSVFEKTTSGCKILADLKDIAGHGLVRVFDFENGAKLVDEYAVYLSGNPKPPSNKNVLPVYFLECIKAKDFALAQKLLSPELCKVAKPKHLANYFGNFGAIYSNCFGQQSGEVWLEYFENKSSFAKKFCFQIEDEKICNIC